MNDTIDKRLAELRAELDAGHKMLADLETKRARLRTTLLRIGGAVQVLEELRAARAAVAVDAMPPAGLVNAR